MCRVMDRMCAENQFCVERRDGDRDAARAVYECEMRKYIHIRVDIQQKNSPLL